MSYLALARKWRPRTFSQLIGQEHVNKALIKSLDQQRLHHAYLFTGTRGVGKTSVARLMAKALNCEQGVSSQPCLQCDACVAIEQGRFIDLIEIDAASKTRVEDTRDVLENIQYAPTTGRFKIYLIDEVHMLSQHSFNALLKTLEEPPEHVKFLLATTDPQKLPVTILSRCLQFNLRHISNEVIQSQLRVILNEEQIPFEEESLYLLARAAQGSMRDALSLLDQAIASVDQVLRADEIKSILGYTQQDFAQHLLQALINMDASQLITISRQIAREGGYYTYVLDEILDYLHQITLCQSLKDKNHPLLKTSDAIYQFAEYISPEDVQLFYQIAMKGREEIHLAPSLLIGFEMTLLRMFTFRPAPAVSNPTLAYEIKPTQAILVDNLIVQPESPTNISSQENTATSSIDSEPTTEIETLNLTLDIPENSISQVDPIENCDIDEDWGVILKQLKLTGLAQTAVDNAEMISKSGRSIQLRVAKGHQSLFTPIITERIEQALSTYFQDPIKISINYHESTQASPAQKKQTEIELKQKKAEASLQQDSLFQQLQQEFSAELVKTSVQLTEVDQE
jgi:DNA polymerase-3 subunit gamma/tau